MANGPFTISDPRAPSVATTQTDAQTAEETAVHDRLYPNTRPAMRPPPGRFYSADPTMQTTYRQHTDHLRSVIGLSEVDTLTSQREVSTMLDEVGLDALSVGRPLYAASVAADVAAVRGTEPSDEQVQSWKEESRRILNAMGSDMGKRYEKFAQSHKTLAAMLNKRGVGVHPTLVKVIAEHLQLRGYR